MNSPSKPSDDQSDKPADSDADEARSNAELTLADASVDSKAVADRRDTVFLLAVGSLFFVIMVGQYVWMIMDKPQPLDWKSGPASSAYKLNINTATWAEWTQLDDIGPDLAMRIVADRNENGQFRTIDDVGRVSGIGRSTLDRIRPLLTMTDTAENTPERYGQSIESTEKQ